MKIVYLALLCLLLLHTYRAKASDEIKMLANLQEQIKEADWKNLTQLVESSSNWPQIPSSFEASKLANESKVVAELKIKLADTLRARIVRQCKPFINNENDMDIRILNDLASMSKRLKQIGCYGNYVLANLCSEIVFYDLSGRLVRNGTADAIADLITNLTPAKADWRASLKNLAQADPFLATPDKASLLEEAVKKQTIIEAFMALGLELIDAGTLYGRRANSFGDMLNGNYVLDLIYSNALNEKAYLIGLRSTVEYIRSGGSLDNISNFNDKQYHMIFEKTESTYFYPPLGVRSLSPYDIHFLINIHSDPRIKENFKSRLLN